MMDLTKIKLGKHAPVYDRRTPRFANYIDSAIIDNPPATLDFSAKLSNLGMMLNDTLGDCTCAAVGHMIQTWTANAGTQVILPDADIETLYEKSCGYVPGDPSTDQGGVEVAVLRYWRDSGIFPGHTLAGWCNVSAGNHTQMKQALQLFGAIYIGVDLPLTAQSQSEWSVVSTTGDGAPGSWGGHAVPIVGYDADTVTVITWGQLLKATWGFLDAYCDEAHGPLSANWIEKDGKTPDGFYWTKLKADLLVL